MNWSNGRNLAIAFGLALLILLGITGLSFVETRNLVENSRLVVHTQEVLGTLEQVLATATDAESGVRGYVVTGDASYLEAYNSSATTIQGQLNQLGSLTSDNPAQQARLPAIESTARLRLDLLRQIVEARRTDGFPAAQAIMLTGESKRAMTTLRDQIGDMQAEERRLLVQRNAAADSSLLVAMIVAVLLTLLDFVLLGAVYLVLRRYLTSRGRAEAARLRVTLASIGDAVITTDATGRITFLNTIAEQLTGWSQADAQGQDMATVFHIINEETRELVANPATHVLAEGVVVGLANHTLLLARDGREVPIEDSGAPIRDEQGTILGVVLVFRDSSERRQAEAERSALLQREQVARTAAETSEQYYRFLAESIPQIVWTARPDGWIDYFNVRGQEYTGMTMEQTQGWGWDPVLHKDDLQRTLDHWTHALATGEVFEIENRFLRASDGSYRWHLGRAIPARDATGQIVKWFGTSTDIDDNKRDESALRILAEASRLLGASLDYETTLATVLRLVVPDLADWCSVDVLAEDGSGRLDQLAVAHVDPAKVVWAQTLREKFPPQPDAPTGAYHVLRTGEPEFYPEITMAMLQAADFNQEQLDIIEQIGFTSVITMPMLVRGRALGTLSMVTAESRRRYTEDDVALAQDLARRVAVAIDNARLYRNAQEAIHTRDQFVSIAAHELKTPLTSLLGYTQLVQRRAGRDGTLSTANQQALAVVVKQATRLNRMISALLDLSRIETGQLSLDCAPVDLNALAALIVQDVQPTMDQHTLHLETPATPVMVNGDALRLEQVLQNLVQNAIKYTPAGGPVMIRVTQDREHAYVAVQDEGIGIPESALDHLFGRFYRAPNVIPQQISGMGIGLYVVKEIVALHDGTISVQSVEGQGSTFTVRLPLLADKPEAGEPVAAAPAQHA